MGMDKKGALSCVPFPVRVPMNHKAWIATCTGFSTAPSILRIRNAIEAVALLGCP